MTMLRRLIIVSLVGVGCFARGVPAEERSALVIGNAKYEGRTALKNPGNDAAAMQTALEALGFRVTKKTDLKLAALRDEVRAYGKTLGEKSVALFFYAGHGVEVKGENFLVPIDVRLTNDFNVERECVKVDEVLQTIGDSKASLKIIILDCCRNNPLSRDLAVTAEASDPKFARIPDGTIIAFATAPGKLAFDGEGENSPFTARLTEAFKSRPRGGLELRNAFHRAGRAVARTTNQRPWMNIDLSLDDYYLWNETAAVEPPPKPLPPPPPTPVIPEVETTLTNTLGMKFRLIAPGKFTMGSPDGEPGPEGAHSVDEAQAVVTLTKPYYFGATEVTQSQWRALMQTEPWKGQEYVREGAAYPATYVSWNDAQEFCKKLSGKERRTFRLPTEAEWEFACRAGTTTAYSSGGDAKNLGEFGWWGGYLGDGNAKSEHFAHEVGQKKPNPAGVFDLHGNVSEWCQDVYVEQLPGGRDPVVSTGGLYRVHRGGSWFSVAAGCRSACRAANDPTHRSYDQGFRVVLNPPEK